MTPVTRKVRVKVPATSANLGSGFDTVGLALDYHDELEFTLSADPVNTAAQVMIEGEGEAVEFYGNAGHMAATDHHLFSLDISDPLAFTKAHCETELNSAEHAIDLLKSLAINAER